MVTVSAFSITAFLIALLGMTALVPSWRTSLLKHQSGDIAVAATCMAAFVLNLPLGLIQRIQYADQRAALSNAWGVLGAALSVIATYAAIWSRLPRWGLVAAVSIATPATWAVATAFYFMAARPELRPSPSLVHVRQVRQLMRSSLPFFVLTVVMSISFNTDSVIVASVINLSEVAPQAVALKIVSVISALVAVFSLPLWPANGEALVRGDHRWVVRTTWRMSALSGFTVAFLSAALVIFIDALTLGWLGRIFPRQATLLAWYCTAMVIMSFSAPFFMVLNSVGRIRLQVIAYMVFLVISVLLKLGLASRYGIIGVAAGGAIAYGLVVLPSVMWGYLRIQRSWSVTATATGCSK
jgi:O-antigen/teichoic acid export membrane protein